MAHRRLPAQRVPAPRVLHYLDPTQPLELTIVTPAQAAARRREQRELYARWQRRQAVIAARDRKVGRFWLGFGAVIGLVTIAAIVAAIWLAWTVIGLLAIPAVVLGGAGLVAGGQRCITVVQHWH
jgi:hypothetical protein